jgi:hypothetical protein
MRNELAFLAVLIGLSQAQAQNQPSQQAEVSGRISNTNPRELMDLYTRAENRTTLFGIINNTPFPVEISFGQIKSKYDVNPPYIKDTGTFVVCGKGTPELKCLFDPIERFGPILATTGSISIRIANQTLNDTYPEPGKDYWEEMTWTVGPRRGSPGTTGEQFELRRVKDADLTGDLQRLKK